MPWICCYRNVLVIFSPDSAVEKVEMRSYFSVDTYLLYANGPLFAETKVEVHVNPAYDQKSRGNSHGMMLAYFS